MIELNIKVELCSEDRARLDNILTALIALIKPAKVPHSVEELEQLLKEAKGENAPEESKPLDDINDMLKKALNNDKKVDPVEPAKNAQDAPEIPDHPTLDPFPEQPKAKTEASEATEKPVSTAELQQLVIALCRAGKKDKVREVVNSYGVPTVAGIPESKRTEAFKTLKALEG